MVSLVRLAVIIHGNRGKVVRGGEDVRNRESDGVCGGGVEQVVR